MKRLITMALAAAAAIAFAERAPAAFIYPAVGFNYMQNFDSLPNTPQNMTLGNTPTGWTDDNPSPAAGNFSIVGVNLWHGAPNMGSEGGSNGRQRMRIGAGTANTGAFMSFGASGSTDRALGMVNSNTFGPVGTEAYLGLELTNNTGRHLSSFTLSYFGEQWRDGGATTPVAQSLTFDYNVGAASIQDPLAVWTDVNALNFTSPTFTNTGGGVGLDGNDSTAPAPINRVAIGPITVENINWQPGATIWLRWTDTNDANNDHGLAIDDLTFSANIPEPTSLALVFLGTIGLLAVRRNR